MIGWQTRNLVAVYKKLKEMYIVLNVEFAQKLFQFLVKVSKLWSRMRKVSNIFQSSSKTSQPVETSTLKQTDIVDANAKQLTTKAEIMWSNEIVNFRVAPCKNLLKI